MQVDNNQFLSLMQKHIENDLFGAATATAYTDDNSLSPDKLLQAYDKLLTPIYYGESIYIELGTIIQVPEGKYNPPYIAFHPQELETIKKQLPPMSKLVPLKDAPFKMPKLEVRVK